MSNQNLIFQKLQEYIKLEEESADKVFNQLALYIYSLESKKHDLYILARILDQKELSKLISYFDGDTINLPTKEEHRTLLLTAVCYYLKVIKGYTWPQIKDMLDLPPSHKSLLSSISVGCKINKINSLMAKEIEDMLKNSKIKDLDTFMNNFKEESL